VSIYRVQSALVSCQPTSLVLPSRQWTRTYNPPTINVCTHRQAVCISISIILMMWLSVSQQLSTRSESALQCHLSTNDSFMKVHCSLIVVPMLWSLHGAMFSFPENWTPASIIIILILTYSPPIPLRLYTLPYWSNAPFLISDIRALCLSICQSLTSAEMWSSLMT